MSKKNGKLIECPVCGKSKYRQLTHTKYRFCSHSCASKIIKNGFKKGHETFNKRKLIHKTDESKLARKQIEYRLWRESVFARDGWICQKCKKRGAKLHPHHILNFAEWVELRFAIDNGITLCEICHRLFHKIFGKKKNTREQIDTFLE